MSGHDVHVLAPLVGDAGGVGAGSPEVEAVADGGVGELAALADPSLPERVRELLVQTQDLDGEVGREGGALEVDRFVLAGLQQVLPAGGLQQRLALHEAETGEDHLGQRGPAGGTVQGREQLPEGVLLHFRTADVDSPPVRPLRLAALVGADGLDVHAVHQSAERILHYLLGRHFPRDDWEDVDFDILTEFERERLDPGPDHVGGLLPISLDKGRALVEEDSNEVVSWNVVLAERTVLGSDGFVHFAALDDSELNDCHFLQERMVLAGTGLVRTFDDDVETGPVRKDLNHLELHKGATI